MTFFNNSVIICHKMALNFFVFKKPISILHFQNLDFKAFF